MFTQRIIVKNVFFFIPEVDMNCSVLLPHNCLSLNRIFIWLSNDIQLK